MKKFILVLMFLFLLPGICWAEPNKFNSKIFDTRCIISKKLTSDLRDIYGIENVYAADYKYHLIIEKGNLFTWCYLMPRIEKVFKKYDCKAVERIQKMNQECE